MGKEEAKGWYVVLLVLSLAILLGPVAAGADELSDLEQELQQQKQRSSELENRVNQLEARQKLKERSFNEKIEDLAQQSEEKKTEAAPTDLRVYWKEGLRLDTPDKNFQLKIGGRIQNDWLWISEDDDIKAAIGEQEDGTEFRRARLYVQGLIYGNTEYKLQLDFAGSQVALKDVYVGLTDLPIGKLRVGHFKEPFSLEELTSAKYLTFLERGLPNTFAPSRNTGFMLHDTAFEDRATWAVGLFRDTDDRGMDMDDGGYNITGRVTGLAWYEDKGASLLHLGAAYSYRNPDDSLRYRARPEAHLTDRFVDTGTFVSDQADLLGLEAAWVDGPLSLQGEYVMASADLMGGSDPDFSGYYGQASYFLTGEHRKYKTSSAAFDRVKPNKNFAWGAGCGAWEVKARYSHIDLDSNAINGGELEDISAGVNWYLNPNLRVMWDYIHADTDDSGEADILMMRLQADF